jgi:hypothetical protein
VKQPEALLVPEYLESIGEKYAAKEMRRLHDANQSMLEAQKGVLNLPKLSVIDENDWEPCSPTWIDNGGNCAKAPRVWNAGTLNHWHPKQEPKEQTRNDQPSGCA